MVLGKEEPVQSPCVGSEFGILGKEIRMMQLKCNEHVVNVKR